MFSFFSFFFLDFLVATLLKFAPVKKLEAILLFLCYESFHCPHHTSWLTCWFKRNWSDPLPGILMKLGSCVCQRKKRKLKEKTKELHACLLSKIWGLCLSKNTLWNKTEEKKRVPSWELLNFQCNEWNRRKRRGRTKDWMRDLRWKEMENFSFQKHK